MLKNSHQRAGLAHRNTLTVFQMSSSLSWSDASYSLSISVFLSLSPPHTYLLYAHVYVCFNVCSCVSIQSVQTLSSGCDPDLPHLIGGEWNESLYLCSGRDSSLSGLAGTNSLSMCGLPVAADLAARHCDWLPLAVAGALMCCEPL